MWELGIDVGGTFIDLVLLDRVRNTIQMTKYPTTSHDQSEGIERGIRKLEVAPGQLSRIVHGMTVGTNAILERRGGVVGIITTRGFQDLVEIGRTSRPRVYDIHLRRPAPLVPRDRRVEVGERTLADGSVAVPVDPAEVHAAAASLREKGCEAVAVCFLHSYRNPANERAAARELAVSYPELHVTLSSDVIPEYREYERFMTAVLNAYVVPVMDRYLSGLDRRLRSAGYDRKVYIMQSGGGLMTMERARLRPVYTVLSGPAAGVVGGGFVAAQAGYPNAITYDMGGTSTDVALISQGQIQFTTEGKIATYPVKSPMIDIRTIGAGGGSIGYQDLGGIIKIGPRSAGASPGPACYGQGGTEATVTDANLVLGRLADGAVLGGEIRIRRDLAERAVQSLADRVGLGVEEMAAGMLRIVNANMAGVIREISVQRGYDPREFALIAFGGAGPMHACALAAELSMPRVVIPPGPGNLCALGLLLSDSMYTRVRTRIQALRGLTWGNLQSTFRELEEEVGTLLDAEGIPEEQRAVERSVDMRYVGQKWEVNVPVPPGAAAVEEIDEAFHGRYEMLYGHAGRSEPAEVVNFRVTAVGQFPKPRLEDIAAASPRAGAPEPGRMDRVYFESWHQTPVYRRDHLAPGHRFTGPAVIEEYGSTSIVLPGQRATVDRFGNIIVHTRGGDEA